MLNYFEDDLVQNEFGHEGNLKRQMFLQKTPSKMIELQNQEELTGPNIDKTYTNSEDLLQKENERTSSLEVLQLLDDQMANNW